MSQRMEQRMDNFHDAIAQTLTEAVEFEKGTLVTVLRAQLTRNLKNAKVTLSVMPEDKKKDVLKTLRKSHHDIVDMLTNKLALRRVPHILWAFDDKESEAAKIEAIINELKAKGEL